ncbi:MAG TPA: hypothetical protein DDZ88_23675 [Verrucomicrobiales bacterium]|nr:hypothetical protein [Verrucomicrobiales bacterium]
MSAIAERIDLRLRQLPPQRAARLERIIVSLLDMVEPEVPTDGGATNGADKNSRAVAALNRIAARGGIAGIGDAEAWQREQRTDRPLPGRD